MNAPAPSSVIGHDAAAALLQLTPAALTKLVGDGVIRRVGQGRYNPAQIIRDYILFLQSEPDRRERNVGQAEIAAHLDLSDRRVRELLTEWGVDHKKTTLSEMRVRYIRKLREEAAGRSGGDDDMSLARERALLTRSQREAQELKNRVARREYAPVGLLADVLGKASAGVVDRLDQLEGSLKRACPDLPEAARTTVMKVIASARNEWVRSTQSLASARLDEITQAEEDAEADAASALGEEGAEA